MRSKMTSDMKKVLAHAGAFRCKVFSEQNNHLDKILAKSEDGLRRHCKELIVANKDQLTNTETTPYDRDSHAIVAQLIDVKSENLKLLSKLINMEEWKIEMANRVSRTEASRRSELKMYAEHILHEKAKYDEVRTAYWEQTEALGTVSTNLRRIAHEKKTTTNSILPATGAQNTLLLQSSERETGHIAVQDTMLKHTRHVLDETKSRSVAYQQQIARLKAENQTLTSQLDTAKDALLGQKRLLQKRAHHAESLRRMEEEDLTGVPYPPDILNEITSVETLRYTPRPEFPKILTDRYGISVVNKPSSVVLNEVVSKLQAKQKHLTRLEDELSVSRQAIGFLNEMKSVQDSKRVVKTTPAENIPTLDSEHQIKFPFLETSMKSVRSLFWTREITVTWCRQAIAEALKLLNNQQDPSEVCVLTMTASITGVLSVGCWLACVLSTRHAKRRPRRKKPSTTNVSTSRPPSPPLGTTFLFQPSRFSRALQRWFLVQYPECELRSRLAYNLHHHCTQFKENEGLCRLFVLLCSGGLPAEVYTDVQHVLKVVKFALRKASNGCEVRLKQAAATMKSLVAGKPPHILLQINCALGEDFKENVPQEHDYATSLDLSDSMTHLSRCLLSYVISQHLDLYSRLEKVFQTCPETFAPQGLVKMLSATFASTHDTINTQKFLECLQDLVDLRQSSVAASSIHEVIRMIPLTITDKLRG